MGTVGGCVPRGFESYIRVFHPATTDRGRHASWSEVGDRTGRRVHPLMQWHALIGRKDPDDPSRALWEGEDPERGSILPSVLKTLCEHLAQFTNRVDACTFGFWQEQIWFTVGASRAGDAAAAQGLRGDREATEEALEISDAQVQLHGRTYSLLDGPLAAADVPEGDPVRPFADVSPNLLWPHDRRWFLSTDIDLDSTILGGEYKLAIAIRESANIEAWPVQLTDSLTFDADTVNEVS